MIKHHKIREVIEDAVMGIGSKEATKTFGMGYDSFQFPYTVSFDCEGKFEVIIEGKKTRVRRVESMTLEELKAEADKQGYRLTKKQPYVPFPSCKCTNYRKGIDRYQCSEGYFWKCPICGLTSKPAKLSKDADRIWYELTMEVYGRPEVKRK